MCLLDPSNSSEHWYAAGFYKPGRVVRWAATIEFESLRYYQTVGMSPSWPKALVFEISIVGSNPTIPAIQ